MIMIDGSMHKHNHKFGFILQSLLVIEKRYKSVHTDFKWSTSNSIPSISQNSKSSPTFQNTQLLDLTSVFFFLFCLFCFDELSLL